MEEDKENLNNEDLLNSSMFASDGGDASQMDSMFASDASGGAADSEPTETPAPSMFSDTEEQPAKEEPKEEVQAESKEESEADESSAVEENKSQNKEKEPIQVIDDSDEEDEDEDEEKKPTDVVTVRPVKFKKFEATPPIRTIKKNLDIMQDISMHISVELGRAKLSIKEVMDFEQGSIVELNKIAGEQVEVFVNGKLVAKGEVIVIEDRFGVRITSTNIAKNAIIP